MHWLVYQLAVADSIVCFITLPMEAAWREDEIFKQTKQINKLTKQIHKQTNKQT